MSAAPPRSAGDAGQPSPLAWQVERLGTVPSTQDLARERALPEGAVLVAERQVAGRGRRRRDWVSPVGGLWATAVVAAHRLDALPSGAWPAVVAVSVAERVGAMGADVRVKWPNDLYLAAPRPGKLAGVLLERAGDRVLVGVGMNVCNEAPSGAASLVDAVEGVNVEDALSAVLAGIAVATGPGAEGLPTRWARLDLLAGSVVTVEDAGGATTGVAAGLAPDGRLRLRTASGEVLVARGRVVTWRGQERA